MMRLRKQSPAGFTLLEVLLALALGASLLLAMNTFIFSLGELWGQGRDRRLFQQHVRAVSRHVDDLLRQASLPRPHQPPDRRGLRVTEPNEGDREARLTFDLPGDAARLAWPAAPWPEVVCRLGVQAEAGLYLDWQSRFELDSEKQPARRTRLTAFATEISYHYLDRDTGRWRDEPRPLKASDGSWPVPDSFTVRFRHGTFESSVLFVPEREEPVAQPES